MIEVSRAAIRRESTGRMSMEQRLLDDRKRRILPSTLPEDPSAFVFKTSLTKIILFPFKTPIMDKALVGDVILFIYFLSA